MTYRLEGTLLEACSCPMPCACWVGEDPPGGYCYALNAYRLERAEIGATDVSGLNLVRVIAIPGNVREARSWREVLLVDEGATEPQHAALVDAFTGKLGGPLADIARLVAEVLGIERVAIDNRVVDGRGTLDVEGVVTAEVRPSGGRGRQRSHVASPKGSHLAHASQRVALPKYGMAWEFDGRSAIQHAYKAVHGA